jgi:hypothetical protein
MKEGTKAVVAAEVRMKAVAAAMEGALVNAEKIHCTTLGWITTQGGAMI